MYKIILIVAILLILGNCHCEVRAHDIHLDSQLTVIDRFHYKGVTIFNTEELGCFYLTKYLEIIDNSHSRLHVIKVDLCENKAKVSLTPADNSYSIRE
jgi:hypothetical protein